MSNLLYSVTACGSISGSAANVTEAAQPNITSVGTLTTLTIDDVTINGNEISSAGASSLAVTPTPGQKLILDGHFGIDGTVITSETDANTTVNAYAGRNVNIESVTFDGGDIGAARIGLGLNSATHTNTLSLGGNSAQAIGLERHTTADTAGSNLSVGAGSATSGATDKNGGILYLKPGVSTGTGISSVRIQRNSTSVSTGTSDNVLSDAIIVMSEQNIAAEATAIDLFEVDLPDGSMVGSRIDFSILATDGTDLQCHTGHAHLAAVNKAGSYTHQFTDAPLADDANANSVGAAIVDTWAITPGVNKVTISVSVVCASIVANSIKIYYTITNSSPATITQL